MKSVQTFFFAALLVLLSSSAFAGEYTGYPCKVRYSNAPDPIAGTAGFIEFSLYTGASCGGTLIKSGLYFFGTGSTEPGVDSNYTFNKDELLSLTQTISTAGFHGKKVFCATRDVTSPYLKQVTSCSAPSN